MNDWLPIETFTREVHSLLRTWFRVDLERLDVDLSRGVLAQARSWLDARELLPSFSSSLPSEAIERIGGDPRVAHDLLFELFAPPRLGAALGRYPERTRELVSRSKGWVRLWDAGCATGEGTWELACALAEAGCIVVAIGTTPWPLERLMAERTSRPHDPERARPLRRLVTAAPLDRVTVRFMTADVRAARPPNPYDAFDVVTCHGVLGGILSAPEDIRLALANLAAAVSTLR